MSMPPPPQQPPGPYGPPPGGPGPYQQPPGQAPYPGQYAGPQPGQYAGPQPAFPQQHPGPHGPVPPGPYGMPQPPRKKRTGLVVGLVAGSLVLLGCLGYGVMMVFDATGDDTPFPAATHKLTVQPKLVDGEYALAQDMSGTEGKKLLDESYSPYVRTDGAAVAQYTAQKGAQVKALVVSGYYGRIKRPDTERRSLLKGAGTAQNATIEVPVKDVTPPGAEVKIECEVLSNTEAGNKVTFPMCAWADGNTAVGVGVVDATTLAQKPADIDLAAAAALTLKVRAEMRTPIG
ncbi:hypothetical protein ABZ498_20775 [Streptomyces lavendulocolor]|uniref:hypothetical protein n=1 Tax=Streptomyces lavendulocolor TaxID=67316 RepID=UPI0034080ACA